MTHLEKAIVRLMHDEFNRTWKLSELCERLGKPRADVFMGLSSLNGLGYINQAQLPAIDESAGVVLFSLSSDGRRAADALPKPRSATRRPAPKRQRRTTPTSRQLKAYGLFMQDKSLAEIGEALGISKQGAGKLVRKAKAILDGQGRSVRARNRLPEDNRGQAIVADDDE